MGLFSNKKKTNTIVDVEVFEKDDKDLYESLLGEISTGSHDVKETVITFPDREVYVRSDSGSIKSAYDSSMGLSLESRLYWAEGLGVDETNLNILLGLAPAALFHDYTKFVEKFPESRSSLSSALEAYVIAVIQKTVADFGKHEKVRTEIIHDSRMAKQVASNDFFDLTPEATKTKIEKLVDSEKEALNTLNIAAFKESEVTFSVEDVSYTATTDLERFVFAAAESKASLEQVRSLAAGFIWTEVLEVLIQFAESETIKVSFPGSFTELPDLSDLEEDSTVQSYLEIANPFEDDEELVDKNALLEAKPLEGIIVEMVNTPGDEPAFGVLADDDGNFSYETLRDDETSLFTAGVSDNIEDDVRKVLAHESVSAAVKDEVILYLRRNNTLEAELTSIEKSIADSRGHYSKNVEVYEDLRFQNNVISVLDDSEIGRDSISVVDTIMEKQDSSNVAFFAVSKLEEERYKINVERRIILQKMSLLVSELFGEGVQGILHRIDLKLQGIERVSNVAFHAPEDDEDEHVDPSFLADLTSKNVASKSKEFTYVETPAFFLLAQEIGFNPFEVSSSS